MPPHNFSAQTISMTGSIILTACLAVLMGPRGVAATSSVTVPNVDLCGLQTAAVAGGQYIVQNNEYNSNATECVRTDTNADFTVNQSAISVPTNGSPGGYPSIYKGCHFGHCTSPGGLPVPVSSLNSGKVTTSWSTTRAASGAYDTAYDIWFNKEPATSGRPDGAEMMVWLNHQGGVQPAGRVVANNVSIGGVTYDVWLRNNGRPTISYTMVTSATSVTNLDLGPLAADALGRGALSSSWFLIGVEAGFELWQGGSGLTTDSYSVTVH